MKTQMELLGRSENENQPLDRRRHKVSEFGACKHRRTEYEVALQVTECLETFKLIYHFISVGLIRNVDHHVMHTCT
jgi:hypothetical protein